jgi:DNA-binding HxlR family transcriptional regulator
MNRNDKIFPDPYITAVDIVGDAWTFLITREAFFGARRFGDFCNVLNISRTRLTERLNHLVYTGVFEKHPYNDTPLRYEYRFTKKGLGLYPIALTLIAWGEEWRKTPKAPKLIHRPCGTVLKTKTVCRSCRKDIHHGDVDWLPIIALSKVPPGVGSVRGWRKMASFDNISDRPDPAIETLKAVGDRWSMLIMYAAQQIEFGFREAQSKLGLAHNILNNRLKHLINAGLLARASDNRNAPYVATESGLAFIDNILATRTWAIDYPPTGIKQWASIRHKLCGADLQVACVCANCDGTVDPVEVSYH